MIYSFNISKTVLKAVKQPLLTFNKLSVLQVSKAVGVHRTSVYNWLKQGLPQNRDKSLNLPDVIEWMITRAKESVRQLDADYLGGTLLLRDHLSFQ